jgi:hypothetical protein
MQHSYSHSSITYICTISSGFLFVHVTHKTVTVPFVIEISLTVQHFRQIIRSGSVENMWASGLGGRAGGLGEAGDSVDVASVVWAAVGIGVGRSGDDGEEAELGAGISNGPIAWAAIGGGEGGSNEVGS